MARRNDLDWEAVERDWRAGIKMKQQISKEHGVSRAAMDKRFAKLGIERDLREKIQSTADALVTQALVTRQVTPLDPVTEKEIVDVNAQAVAMVQIRHREDIGRGRSLTNRLFDELEVMCVSKEELAELADMLNGQEKVSDRSVELFHKIIGHNNRVGSVKQLVETLKNLIALERQAFGMDKEEAGGNGSYEKLLAEVLAE